jgi:hypothetical protein
MKELVMVSSNRVASYDENEKSCQLIELILVTGEPTYHWDNESHDVRKECKTETHRICIPMDRIPIVIQSLAIRYKEWADKQPEDQPEKEGNEHG